MMGSRIFGENNDNDAKLCIRLRLGGMLRPEGQEPARYIALLLPAKMTTKTSLSRRQTMSMLFLAANVEALSKHLKAWRWARSRCRALCDLRI